MRKPTVSGVFDHITAADSKAVGEFDSFNCHTVFIYMKFSFWEKLDSVASFDTCKVWRSRRTLGMTASRCFIFMLNCLCYGMMNFSRKLNMRSRQNTMYFNRKLLINKEVNHTGCRRFLSFFLFVPEVCIH